MEGEVWRLSIEDRVVVAAAQLQCDFAGDGLGDPAGGFAKHHGLGVEPAALVEQAAELAAIVAVLLDGVFVVNAGDEALVCNEEQGEAGGLVDQPRDALAPLTQAWGMIAAGVTVIVNADLGSWQDDLALVLFCLVASSVVITLELFATFRRERARAFTTAIRSWIEGHLDQVIVVLFLGIGLYLVASSIYGLATS